MNPVTAAALSNSTYESPPLEDAFITVAGIKYEILARRDSSTGYQGTVYRSLATNEVIVAHRGTEFDREPLLDGGIDAAMVAARINPQLDDALALTKQAIRMANEMGYGPVHVTGHSLGDSGLYAGGAEKAPYEVRRRGGEMSAHAGVRTALGHCSLPSAPLPLNRFLLAADAQRAAAPDVGGLPGR